jgi:PhnB protein
MPLDTGSNVSLSLSGNDEAELKGYWDKLSVGATISVPLAPAPWGDMFGMLTDKFGIQWLVNIAPQK